MQQGLFDNEENTIREYNFRIVPEEPIYSNVVGFKEEFLNKFGEATYLKSKPHITVLNFFMDSSYEERMLTALKIATQNSKSFTIETLNFEGFQHSRALTIKLKVEKVLFSFQKEIKGFWVKHLGFKSKNLQVVTTPHITLAKVDTDDLLKESLVHFTQNKYAKTFTVNGFTLLSRPAYKNVTWDWDDAVDYKLQPISEPVSH